MFLSVNGNFPSPDECALIILSDKKRSTCDEKIGSESHPGALEWLRLSESLFPLTPFQHPPCLSVCRSLSVSESDGVKYHLSGVCRLDWREIRTDQLDS